MNPFKLLYFRIQANMSIGELAVKSGVPEELLINLEQGNKRGRQPQNVHDFARLDAAALHQVEKVLRCPNQLKGGTDDDFATSFVDYYIRRRPGQDPKAVSRSPNQSEHLKPAGIVFDFDGTLTTGSVRTTWERLWVACGYTVNDCGALAAQYFNRKITHDQWCQHTLEQFKARGLTQEMVRQIGREVRLIDGFDQTIAVLRVHDIPLYITSGSISDVIIEALGERHQHFKRIECNTFHYTREGTILNIVGTRWDFEGKGEFVKMIARDLEVSPEDILFIGNSRNDEEVKPISGCKTLLINPHFTSPDDRWDYFISDLSNLSGILRYAGVHQDDLPQVVDRQTTVDTALTLLSNNRSINLAAFTVVGGYRRFNDRTRAQLQRLVQSICASVAGGPGSRQNYLLAASPGSGKTFLVQEVARSLGPDVHFEHIDLNKDDKDLVVTKLNQVASCGRNCLCLIDEIDGKPDEHWPYDVIYKSLDLNDLIENPAAKHATVFVLVGSTGGSLNGLRLAMQPRFKAKDLIDRVSDHSKFCMEIPSLDIGDGVCVYLTKVCEAALLRNKTVTHVNKLAVYHAALTALSSPRQIKMLADEAVDRLLTGTILYFDHHFDPGDNSRWAFRQEHKTAAESLANVNLEITGGQSEPAHD